MSNESLGDAIVSDSMKKEQIAHVYTGRVTIVEQGTAPLAFHNGKLFLAERGLMRLGFTPYKCQEEASRTEVTEKYAI